MKKSVMGKSAMLLAAVALIGTISVSVAGAGDAPVKKKGPALQQLEDLAGKKIEDVKVPEVSKPTPAKSSYDVNKSSSSYDVNNSSSTAKGK